MAVQELVIETDPWLAEQMQRDVYTLNFNREYIHRIIRETRVAVDSGNFDHLREVQSKRVFISAKVSTLCRDHVDTCRFLEDRGFHLVDTNLTFYIHDNEFPPPPEQGEIEFRDAKPSDCEAVVDIARRSFRYSRFHLDPDIPDELANQIKGAWTENYFNGKRGDMMIVAAKDERVVGFTLLITYPPNVRIDLIAVDPDFQKRGIAGGMICSVNALHTVTERSSRNGYIVGTQISNEPSISLYQRLGFHLTSSEYVYHYHRA